MYWLSDEGRIKEARASRGSALRLGALLELLHLLGLEGGDVLHVVYYFYLESAAGTPSNAVVVLEVLLSGVSLRLILA